MNKWIKYSAAVLSTACMMTTAMSQNKKNESSNGIEEKTQEIVILKKGGKTEKMTIVVEGDNVTVNGKPMGEYKNKEVTIIKRERAPGDNVRIRGRRAGSPMGAEDMENAFNVAGNKALLGVLTAKSAEGVKVTEVSKESGAEKAGLKKDDIITKVGAIEVKEPADLVAAIGEYKPSDKVDITYKRDGKESKTSAVLSGNKSRTLAFNFDKDFNFEMPKGVIPPMENFNFNFNRKPKIGLQIQDVEEGKGVTVKDVDDDSPAAKAGIKDGDVITQVDGKDVIGVDDLRAAIKDLKEGENVKLTYKRNGKSQTSELKIPKKLKTADL